ncbi:NADP-dependent oxidoreductase [Treponema sp. OttesenSCG-928-L16]|nr:NADP-dependent oxidoreductase [Treponema sp. OttesenSCG-928-L16]
MTQNQEMNTKTSIRVLRFHRYGEPLDVLGMEQTAPPVPGPGTIRVTVRACGLNPADWHLCRGFMAGDLPRGIGLDVSGIVDAVGEGVTGAAVGDAVLGCTDFAAYPSAGMAEQAILDHWAKMPEGLGFAEAAALPLVVVTAYSHLEALGVKPGQTLVVHGAGTMVGFAAVQMALMRGTRVIATAGSTFADQLRTMGAAVTSYGDGMAERVGRLAGQPVDWVLDTAPVSGILPDLIKIAGGDPKRVMTVSDHAAAPELGVRGTFTEGFSAVYDVIGEYAQYAAEGKFIIPVAQSFTFDDWRSAAAISQGGHAHGKLILLPAAE